jgi:hypothetical protein
MLNSCFYGQVSIPFFILKTETFYRVYTGKLSSWQLQWAVGSCSRQLAVADFSLRSFALQNHAISDSRFLITVICFARPCNKRQQISPYGHLLCKTMQ